MKLETSRNVTKSKRSLHWCRSISKNICARFITVSVKKLLHYRAGGLLQYRAFYYIIGQLLQYRAFFITLSGSYYSIGVYYIIGWYSRGMTESVRQQWLYSTQAFAEIHDAMTSLTGKHHITT